MQRQRNRDSTLGDGNQEGLDASSEGGQWNDRETIIMVEDTNSKNVSKTTRYVKTFFMIFTYLGTVSIYV